MKVFAIDIGGSSVKYALLEVERGKAAILTAYKPEQLPSNLFSDLRGIVVAVTEYALQNEDISTVAISTTGNVDQNGTVRRAEHFQGYENVSWPDILRSEF